MLTPAQIEATTFTQVRLEAGYRQKEVDDFLDQVVKDYTQAYGDAARAQNATRAAPPLPQDEPTQVITAPPAAVAPDGPSVASIGRLLASAEAQAAEIVEQAKRDAAGIAAAAQVNADSTARVAAEQAAAHLIQAKADAEKLVTDAQTERHAAIGALEEQRVKLQGHVDVLTSTRSALTSALKVALNAVLPDATS